MSDGFPTCERILADLEDACPSLSPQLRRAAGYLIERPDEIAFTSMRQLAERADVQPATMVRLAQAVGFDGYEALREPFRMALRDQPSGFTERARSLMARTGRRGGSRALAQLANEMVATDRENLGLSLEAIGADELADAARVLSNSRRVYVIGQRSLYPAAFYMHHACAMFRDDVILVDGGAGAFADSLRGLGRDDAVVVFGFDPYVRSTIEAASLATRRGAAVIAVTDSLVSPLAAMTRHMLLVATDTPALFRSVVPAMAVSQVLVAQMLAQGGQEALSRLAESEDLLDSFGVYGKSVAAHADDTNDHTADDNDSDGLGRLAEHRRD